MYKRQRLYRDDTHEHLRFHYGFSEHFGLHRDRADCGLCASHVRCDAQPDEHQPRGTQTRACNCLLYTSGAGTFSDGKLTTRIKDARAQEVVSIFAEHGAPEEIKTMAKPHIGTDKLVQVVKNLRLAILRMGGEVRFETRLAGFERNGDALSAVYAQSAAGRERIPCAACILATGHGASDTYRMLAESGLLMQAKPFAAGVRIEHPRELIDRSQFGAFAGHPRLGAAEYHLADQSGGRGVYTFCMCPGGSVVACASEPVSYTHLLQWGNSKMVTLA